MPRGDKSKYTGKQLRKAEHIEKSYEDRGVPAKEAEARAWATVNKDDGGGKQGGSGVGKSTGHPAARGWPQGRRRLGQTPRRRAFSLGQKGGRDPRASRGPLIVLGRKAA